MKPVDQTIFYDPAGGIFGNCLAACVASLLELPLEDVPNFCAGDEWSLRYALFLRDYGYSLIDSYYFSDGPFPADLGEGIGGLFIGSGQSPRGVSHAVIIDGQGDLVHDPHPSRAGVSRVVAVDVIERITGAVS